MKKLIVILSALAPALLCSLNLNALEVGEKACLRGIGRPRQTMEVRKFSRKKAPFGLFLPGRHDGRMHQASLRLSRRS